MVLIVLIFRRCACQYAIDASDCNGNKMFCQSTADFDHVKGIDRQAICLSLAVMAIK